LILYGLAAAGTGALAQENSNTIGPPQLKDFTLPGQRTTPPAATPPAPRTIPPPAATTPRSAPAATPPAGRDRSAPAPRPAAPAARRDTAPAATAPAPTTPAPQTAAPAPVETLPAPLPVPEAAAPQPAAPEPQSTSWLWPAAGGALVLLLAGLVLLRRRRAKGKRGQRLDAARGELGAVPVAEPEPRPVPAPEPKPETPAAPRPWLELDIIPERAAATEAEALVHYALTVTNQGEAEARNIRIDPRLFNAGAEGDMAAFFQGPIHEQSGSPHIVIAPGGTLKLNGQVALPMAELQEMEVAGRRIFVPMVAINVAYDWAGGGTGRTSRSWLVGREAETPQAKMGPFRLDLGPRIYRSVGRREARLVRV
jgi:hypothetical protein